MKRGRVRPWRPEEDAYLVENYATMPSSAIAFYLHRTESGVWKRASRLLLKKQHGGNFQPGHTPANKGKKTKAALLVIAALKCGPMSMRELIKATGASESAIGSAIKLVRADKDIGLHVKSWDLIPPRHWAARYALGHGESAPRPVAKPRIYVPKIQDPYEIQPIPRPAAYLWGQCIAAQAA